MCNGQTKNFLFESCETKDCDECFLDHVLEDMKDPRKVPMDEFPDYLSLLVDVVIGLRADIKDLKRRL